MLDCILLIQEWDREYPRTPRWLILSFHVDHAAALPYVMEKVG